MKVIQFPVVKKDKDDNEQMFEQLKEDLDELVFVKIDTKGGVSLGHTPMSNAGVMMMYYSIQKYMMDIVDAQNGQGRMN